MRFYFVCYIKEDVGLRVTDRERKKLEDVSLDMHAPYGDSASSIREVLWLQELLL